MENAKVVFPTPGGPTKHNIGPLMQLVTCFTAKYSIILVFTFSKPSWEESNFSLTSSKLSLSIV